MSQSPYARKAVERWGAVTAKLLREFPISTDRLVEIVLKSWSDIFESRIGTSGHKLGLDIRPEPQIMGFLLHELIPLHLAAAYPDRWRRGAVSSEFDARYVPDDRYSFEIKTSSSKSGIFGNRSYAHISQSASKRRGGYLLAVNFAKFTQVDRRPEVTLIRFGWLDPADWVGQAAPSGQQAHLTKEARAYKLRVLWEGSKQ